MAACKTRRTVTHGRHCEHEVHHLGVNASRDEHEWQRADEEQARAHRVGQGELRTAYGPRHRQLIVQKCCSESLHKITHIRLQAKVGLLQGGACQCVHMCTRFATHVLLDGGLVNFALPQVVVLDALQHDPVGSAHAECRQEVGGAVRASHSARPNPAAQLVAHVRQQSNVSVSTRCSLACIISSRIAGFHDPEPHCKLHRAARAIKEFIRDCEQIRFRPLRAFLAVTHLQGDSADEQRMQNEGGLRAKHQGSRAQQRAQKGRSGAQSKKQERSARDSQEDNAQSRSLQGESDAVERHGREEAHGDTTARHAKKGRGSFDAQSDREEEADNRGTSPAMHAAQAEDGAQGRGAQGRGVEGRRKIPKDVDAQSVDRDVPGERGAPQRDAPPQGSPAGGSSPHDRNAPEDLSAPERHSATQGCREPEGCRVSEERSALEGRSGAQDERSDAADLWSVRERCSATRKGWLTRDRLYSVCEDIMRGREEVMLQAPHDAQQTRRRARMVAWVLILEASLQPSLATLDKTAARVQQHLQPPAEVFGDTWPSVAAAYTAGLASLRRWALWPELRALPRKEAVYIVCAVALGQNDGTALGGVLLDAEASGGAELLQGVGDLLVNDLHVTLVRDIAGLRCLQDFKQLCPGFIQDIQLRDSHAFRLGARGTVQHIVELHEEFRCVDGRVATAAMLVQRWPVVDACRGWLGLDLQDCGIPAILPGALPELSEAAGDRPIDMADVCESLDADPTAASPLEFGVRAAAACGMLHEMGELQQTLQLDELALASAAACACAAQKLDMLDWLLGRAVPLPVHRCVAAASKRGAVAALEWLATHHIIAQPSVLYACVMASEHGHLAVLEWAECQVGQQRSWNAPEVYAAAARAGQGGVMAWMVQRTASGVSAAWQADAPVQAAAHGHATLLTWMVRLGCPHDPRAWVAEAVKRGDLYLLEHGGDAWAVQHPEAVLGLASEPSAPVLQDWVHKHPPRTVGRRLQQAALHLAAIAGVAVGAITLAVLLQPM